MTSDRQRERLIEQVVKAWVDAGRRPDYHELQKRRLVLEWPTLAIAVNNLAEHDAQRRGSETESEAG